MLIRKRDGGAECVLQAHHALISGVLAGSWRPTGLDPLVVQAIGLHDDPWRAVDRSPVLNEETGWPRDFLTVPVEEKIEFYTEGIDRLESVHPYVAYLVSRHYTTFAGTRDEDALCEPEADRRERLERRLTTAQIERADRALSWMKYFDVWSLYLCLAGPAGKDASVPDWLDPKTGWLEAPDGTQPEIRWLDDLTLAVEPFVFGDASLGSPIEFRYLKDPSHDQQNLADAWRVAPVQRRDLTLVAPDG